MQPWSVRFDLSAKPRHAICEYACHEGKYGVKNMLTAARAEQRGAAAKARNGQWCEDRKATQLTGLSRP